jgi:uncharacterized protein
MKRTTILTLLVLGFATVGAVGAKAQAKSSTKETPSLLYRVTGKGITKPSYIFGTFHAVCPTEMVPFESLDTYLDQTDQLMMEIDMDDPAEMLAMTKGVIMSDGKTLKDYLKPEEFAKVDEMVKNLLGYSAENVKMVKPAILAVLLVTSPKAIGCTPTVYDMSLMQSAVAKKRPVVGLETVESQVKVIDSKPIQEQAKELYEMAADPQKSINELKKLMAAYKTRDPEKLIDITNDQLKSDKAFHARLLDERNTAWIPRLESAFRERPTFVAVGAGHLGGKNGVIRLLRAKGYQVTPVKL